MYEYLRPMRIQQVSSVQIYYTDFIDALLHCDEDIPPAVKAMLFVAGLRKEVRQGLQLKLPLPTDLLVLRAMAEHAENNLARTPQGVTGYRSPNRMDRPATGNHYPTSSKPIFFKQKSVPLSRTSGAIRDKLFNRPGGPSKWTPYKPFVKAPPTQQPVNMLTTTEPLGNDDWDYEPDPVEEIDGATCEEPDDVEMETTEDSKN